MLHYVADSVMQRIVGDFEILPTPNNRFHDTASRAAILPARVPHLAREGDTHQQVPATMDDYAIRHGRIDVQLSRLLLDGTNIYWHQAKMKYNGIPLIYDVQYLENELQ